MDVALGLALSALGAVSATLWWQSRGRRRAVVAARRASATVALHRDARLEAEAERDAFAALLEQTYDPTIRIPRSRVTDTVPPIAGLDSRGVRWAELRAATRTAGR